MNQQTTEINYQGIETVADNKPIKPGFDEFLTRYYLNWQLINGRASIREFAKWLGVNHSLVVQWMNDRGLPGPKSIPTLVSKLGVEVLDYVNYPRPPACVLEMIITHAQLPSPDRVVFESDFDQWLGIWLKEHGFTRVK